MKKQKQTAPSKTPQEQRGMQVVVYRPQDGHVVESIEHLGVPAYAEYAEMKPIVEAILDGAVFFKNAPGNFKYAVWFRDDGAFDRKLRPSVLGLVGTVVVVPFKGDGFRSVTDADVEAIARIVRSGRSFS